MKQDCRCVQSYYNNKPKAKLESQTTNQASYKAYPIQSNPIVDAPKVVQRHYDANMLKSSYQSSFTKPPMQSNNTSQSNLVNQYFQNKPKNVLSSETEYNKTFKAHEIKPHKQPPVQYKPKQTKFEGESSYKANFTQKHNSDLDKANKTANSINEYLNRKPKVAFEGSSSYKDNFKNYGVRPERQPEFKYEPKKSKFEGESSYKATFKEYGREAYGQGSEHCPVHPDRLAIK